MDKFSPTSDQCTLKPFNREENMIHYANRDLQQFDN